MRLFINILKLIINLFFMLFAIFGVSVSKGGLSMFSVIKTITHHFQSKDMKKTKIFFHEYIRHIKNIVRLGLGNKF